MHPCVCSIYVYKSYSRVYMCAYMYVTVSIYVYVWRGREGGRVEREGGRVGGWEGEREREKERVNK